jgi:hypothetical protein
LRPTVETPQRIPPVFQEGARLVRNGPRERQSPSRFTCFRPKNHMAPCQQAAPLRPRQ